MIELSIKLGIPRSELIDRLTPEDFYTYLAYYTLKPIDDVAYHSAQQLWIKAQLKSTKPLESKDFYTDWFEDEDKPQLSNHIANPLILLGKIANAGGKIKKK